MEYKLSIIDSNFIRKRISKEIAFLLQQNICNEDDVKIQINTETSYRNMVEYDISFKNLNNNKYYKFIISNNYPFNPPKIKVNNKSLIFYHKITNEIFRDSLKKFTGIQCFCCETILCSNNWSPQFTFNDIIKDINYFTEANRQVVIRVIIDIIKRKYLIADINIVEWLY